MENKIYILPQDGKYSGTLLVLDYVESMSHVSNSKVPQHPVESLNRSVADHRYRDAIKIHISGNISNNWETKVKTQETPVFKTMANKEKESFRKVITTPTYSDKVVKAVNAVLDRNMLREGAIEFYVIPSSDRGILATAEFLVDYEDDIQSIAEEQGASLTNQADNAKAFGSQINTILQAQEMLTHLDETSSLVTIFSIYKYYPNMVMTSFTNPLRNGVERGAYWVNLSFEQQLVATTSSTIYSVSISNSEAVSTKSDSGKQEVKIDPSTRKTLEDIYNYEVKEYNLKNSSDITQYINDEEKEVILNKASLAYNNAGNEKGVASARGSIKGSLTHARSNRINK